jgi:hypothetical protein
MGTLAFHCPRTGKPITSGIETDPYTLRSVRTVALRVYCPHCEAEHEFHAEDGALVTAA